MTFLESALTEWRNVYVIGVVSLLDKLQCGLFVWSLWPYLRQLDPTVSSSVVGIAFALVGLGEAVASPLLGWYSNRRNGVLKGLVMSYCISLLGNALYLYAKILPTGTIYAVLLSRFLLGVAAANKVICFSYSASISTVEDRSRVISIVNGGTAIGQAIGPGMQALINYVVLRKYIFFGLEIDVNNVNALMGVVINILCLATVVALLDEESAEKDVHVEDIEVSSTTNSTVPLGLDKSALGVCILCRVDKLLVQANFKSIGFLYSEIMFDYTETQALRVNSNVTLISSFLVLVAFFLCACTSFLKIFSEKLLVAVAVSITLGFHLLTVPWPFLGGTLPYCQELNISAAGVMSWCGSIHSTNEYLYYGGFVLLQGVTLPLTENFVKIILTKLLGPGKQGKIIGITNTIGCTSKIVGPIVFSFLFEHYGPQPNWALVMASLGVLLLLWLIYYRRLS